MYGCFLWKEVHCKNTYCYLVPLQEIECFIQKGFYTVLLKPGISIPAMREKPIGCDTWLLIILNYKSPVETFVYELTIYSICLLIYFGKIIDQDGRNHIAYRLNDLKSIEWEGLLGLWTAFTPEMSRKHKPVYLSCCSLYTHHLSCCLQWILWFPHGLLFCTAHVILRICISLIFTYPAWIY